VDVNYFIYFRNFTFYRLLSYKKGGVKLNKKKTIEEVHNFFNEKGYILLSKVYVNNKGHLEYLCPRHKEKGSLFITLNSLLRGCGCRWCGYENGAKSQSIAMKKRYETEDQHNKLDIQHAQTLFSSRSLNLISTEYLGVMEPLEFSCNKHLDKPNQFVRPNDLKKPSVKYGCRWCGIEARSGKRSYLWKGGISPENHIARTNGKALNFKKLVLTRDNYTCQCCGANRLGKNRTTLNVHHKQNFSVHKELRYEIDNGITLCFDCHSNNSPVGFHRVYTTKNNTPEQLEEYIRDRRKTLGLTK
jgi:hypothetical protein